MQSWVAQWAALLSSAPVQMALAVLLLPVALAVFSRKPAVVLCCFLLVTFALRAVVAPGNIAAAVATGDYSAV